MPFRVIKLTLAILSLLATLILVAFSGAAADTGTSLTQQRAAFRSVRADVERGNWQVVAPHQQLLKRYPLWPDLRAMYFKAHLDKIDHDEINTFLDEYASLKPARELRYRYALKLADENMHAQYLALYQQFYQGLEIAKLDCLALQAEIATGRAHRITSRALVLWNVGRNQVDECDTVFDNLRTRDLLTRDQYLNRFTLAIEAKQFSLARYLAKSIGSSELSEAEEWLRAHNQPSALLDEYLDYADTALSKALFAYAVERVAYKDPLSAANHWQLLTDHFSFSEEQIGKNNRHIALWAARLHLPEAGRMLSALPATVRDVEVGRWMVRNHLLFRRWSAVADAIAALPVDEQLKDEWRYWDAVAGSRSDQNAANEVALQILAEQRGYYGFLAADVANLPYALTDEPMLRDDTVTGRLADIPSLVRARELFYVGLESKGRSEWDAEMRLLSADEQIQAALLADDWGWHSRAIATVAKAGVYDDLSVRYPLPWREHFEYQASSNGISSSWAYGIARSESLFMRDVRSSAGAVGLMQLMPATGRQSAKEIQLPWSGIATLTDSTSNIRLGTHYLGKMFARFDNNRILATAAYNAGPARVDAWLPETGSMDGRIWIENIPFNETRAYVRRVLTDDAIFHWRMTGKLKRVSAELPKIVAVIDAQKTRHSD